MIEYIDYLLDSVVNFVVALFDDFIEMFIDLVFWIYEEILNVLGWVIDYVDAELPSLGMEGYWSMVSDDLIQVLNYIDFAQCIGIIVAAITLRFFLNFVPFIR